MVNEREFAATWGDQGWSFGLLKLGESGGSVRVKRPGSMADFGGIELPPITISRRRYLLLGEGRGSRPVWSQVAWVNDARAMTFTLIDQGTKDRYLSFGVRLAPTQAQHKLRLTDKSARKNAAVRHLNKR